MSAASSKRIQFSRFEPEGISGEQFLMTYWEDQEERVEERVADSVFGPDVLAVNPNPDRWLNSFAIKCHPTQMEPDGFHPPNLKVSDSRYDYRFWFVLPIQVSEGERSKAENLFLMVRHCYASLLSGIVQDTFPNPFTLPEVTFDWQRERTNLSHLRVALLKASNWTDTLPKEFASRGGSSASQAKQAAARANLQAVNDGRKAKADKSAQQLLAEIDKGRTYAEIATVLHISEESVLVAVSRAKARLGLNT